MRKITNKKTLINIITTFFFQLLTIVNGFIVPKIIIEYFGSNVNGLVASITQFLSYIALIEGGVTGVIMASLYKPLYNNDHKTISSIINAANNFYKKIAWIFVIYCVFLSILYPIIFNTGFSFLYVFSLIIILSISMFIQYMFSLTTKTLLNSDKKVYIVSITQSIILIINIISVYLSVKIYPNIHILKLISSFLYIAQPIAFNHYVKKHYIIDKTEHPNQNLIKSRWDGFAINISAFIHNGTDVVVLTLFTNLFLVSVYSVYSLVCSGIKQIIISFTTAINPTIGEAYAKGDINELNDKLDIYEYIMFVLVYIFFTVGGLLITPFVQIYTSGIQDANYYQPVFGYLLLLSEAIYLIKNPHLNLSYSAGKFKEIKKPAFIEALINIIVSLILVKKYNLLGVAIGTLSAMIYRTIFHIKFTKKLINRKQWLFYKKIIVFSISTVFGLSIFKLIPPVKYNIADWLTHGIIYTAILLVLYMCMSLIYFKKEIIFIKNYFKKKI